MPARPPPRQSFPATAATGRRQASVAGAGTASWAPAATRCPPRPRGAPLRHASCWVAERLGARQPPLRRRRDGVRAGRGGRAMRRYHGHTGPLPAAPTRPQIPAAASPPPWWAWRAARRASCSGGCRTRRTAPPATPPRRVASRFPNHTIMRKSTVVVPLLNVLTTYLQRPPATCERGDHAACICASLFWVIEASLSHCRYVRFDACLPSSFLPLSSQRARDAVVFDWRFLPLNLQNRQEDAVQKPECADCLRHELIH